MYAELLEEESIQVNFLAVLRPRRKVSDFVLFSGSVYLASLDITEYVYKVFQNSTELTRGSSTSLAAGEFYFDEDAKILYVRMSDSSNPSNKFVVASYELYAGTFDAHWYRDPLDDTSKQVYFEPIIKTSPTIKSVTGEILFGSIPVQSTTLDLLNAEHTLEAHIFESSFNKCEVLVYHWLDTLTDENIKLVMNAVGGDISYDQDSVKLSLLDRNDSLNDEWRNATKSFFAQADFANIDPQFIGRPIRYVFGRVEGFKPVNIGYNDTSPTTSDNRDFVVMNEQLGLAEVTHTVGASSTTTQTNLDSAEGIYIGDSVWIDDSSEYYVKVTGVSYSPAFIEHEAIGAPANPGAIVRRGFVSLVTILQSGQKFEALYGRDYTIDLAQAVGCAGFVFSTSLESNLSMPSTLSPTDSIFCTVYGRTNNVTLGGPAFGTDDSEVGNLADPVVILFHILKTKLGFGESQLNLPAFTQLLSDLGGQAVGIAIPKTTFNDFPKFKDLITDILQTILTRLFLDDNLKWSAVQIAPLGSEDKTLEQEEILDGTLSYNFSYRDLISDVIVEYNFQEISDTTIGERTDQVSQSSDTATYLHQEKSSKTFKSLHFKQLEATDLATKISFFFGERSGKLTVASKNRFFDTLLGDTIAVTRDHLPGQDFKYSVEESQKSLRRVQLVLNDQKGIEDNSTSWP